MITNATEIRFAALSAGHVWFSFLQISVTVVHSIWLTFKIIQLVRRELLTTVIVKNTIFWDGMPCSLVGDYRRFGRTYCLLLQEKIKQNFTTFYTANLYGIVHLEIILSHVWVTDCWSDLLDYLVQRVTTLLSHYYTHPPTHTHTSVLSHGLH
jgi:hypothetical protein